MDRATQIKSRMGDWVAFRHRLHQVPELGYAEFKTAELIRGQLRELGIPYVEGPADAPTATIAWIGDTSKPCVALRADIDALPIEEATGLPYASTHPGNMHACGHDGHITMVLAAAGLLKDVIDDLPVCVKFIWQPAEEGGGGAARLVKAGVLDGRIGPKVSAIFGIHGWPGLPVGTVSTRPGALLAATDIFSATFEGRGCHGAFPHLGRDPITTAAEAILNVQQFVSREFDPTDAAVVTVGKFHAGTAVNIIPDRAVIEGTVRTLSAEARVQAQAALARRFSGIAAANDCRVDFVWKNGYPPTVNDPDMADYVAGIARKVAGANGYVPAARPAMGGEDFAYYLQDVPGCFFLIGVIPEGRSDYPPLHNERFDFTDAAIATGVNMYLSLVTEFGSRAK